MFLRTICLSDSVSSGNNNYGLISIPETKVHLKLVCLIVYSLDNHNRAILETNVHVKLVCLIVFPLDNHNRELSAILEENVIQKLFFLTLFRRMDRVHL